MKKLLGSHLPLEERKFFHSLIFPMFFVLVLICVKVIEELDGLNFTKYGIMPQSRFGFWAIFTAPLIHQNADHLLGNCGSLLILGSGLFYFYSKSAYQIFFTIWLLAGFGLWLGGREAYHIGASGIIYGLIVFLLLGSIIRKNKPLGAISFLVILFYGGFLWGIFPIDPNLPYSWEAHLWGSLAGLAAVFLFRNSAPVGVFQPKIYSFDLEEDLLDDNEDRYWEIPLEDQDKEEEK